MGRIPYASWNSCITDRERIPAHRLESSRLVSSARLRSRQRGFIHLIFARTEFTWSTLPILEFEFDPTAADIMVYTLAELEALKKNQLQDLCALIKHSQSGTKQVMAQRVFDHQAEIPPGHVKMTPDKNYIPYFLPPAAAAVEQRAWLEDFKTEMRLCDATIDALRDNNFLAKDDIVQLLTADVMEDLNVPVRDRLAIMR